MTDFTQTFQDLPWGGLIPVSLLIVVGLLLWAAGKRILRFAFAAVGLLIGACAGWIIGDMLNMDAFVWVFALIGGGTVAFIAVLAYRFAVAIAMAVILAIAAPLAAISVAELQAARAGRSLSEGEIHNPITDAVAKGMQKIDQPELRQQVADTLKSMSDSLSQVAGSVETPEARGTVHEQLQQLREFGRRMVETVRQKWDQTPPSFRPTLIVSAILGAIVGLFVGALASTFSAAAITSLGGSLLWLGGVRVVAAKLGIGDGWMPATGASWLIVWLITSALGVVIQWTFRRRTTDKAGA